MPRTLILAAALALSATAQAQPMDTTEFCGTMRDAAYQTAIQRDRGAPIGEMYRVVDDKVTRQPMNRAVKQMVTNIYQHPEQSPQRAASLTLKACLAAFEARAAKGGL
jgi:hypothetical protein